MEQQRSQQLPAQKAKPKNRKILWLTFSIAMLLLLLVVSYFGYRTYRSNQEKVKKQQAEQAEQKRIEEINKKDNVQNETQNNEAAAVLPKVENSGQ